MVSTQPSPGHPVKRSSVGVLGFLGVVGLVGAEELRTTDLHPTSIGGLGQIRKQQILLFLLSLFLRTTGKNQNHLPERIMKLNETFY